MKAGDQNFPAFEAGRRILATWPDQGGAVHVELGAGVARRDRLRLALIALIYDRLVAGAKLVRDGQKKEPARNHPDRLRKLSTHAHSKPL